MKKYIIQVTKDKIEALRRDHSNNFIAKEYHSQFDTPEAKKQVDSADHNMANIAGQIEWLERFLKSQSPKK